MISKRTKKAASILMALALLFGFGVSTLWAAPGDEFPDFNPDRAVNLVVEKLLTSAQPQNPGDGKPWTNSLGKGVDVEFTLQRLDPDNNNAVLGTYYGKTGTNGQITAWYPDTNYVTAVSLPQGFYLLQETNSPYSASGANPWYEKAADTYLSLPYDTGNNTFIYELIVYPKNVGGEYSKAVVNQALAYGVGDTVTWKIETFINSGMTDYLITDELDDRLTYNSVTVYYDDETVAANQLPAAAYTAACDTNNVLTVALTDAASLVDDTGATKIITIINTTINDDAFSGNDIIFNDATLSFDTDTDSYSFDTNEVFIVLATLNLIKVDTAGNPLAGATFSVSAADGTNHQFTTGADGVLNIVGIPCVADATSVKVVLQETVAPSGYVKINGDIDVPLSPITKTIGTNFQYVSYNSLNSNGDPYPIQNRTPSELPKTGGIGTIIFTAIGLILIAGAAVLLIRTRKTATK